MSQRSMQIYSRNERFFLRPLVFPSRVLATKGTQELWILSIFAKLFVPHGIERLLQHLVQRLSQHFRSLFNDLAVGKK